MTTYYRNGLPLVSVFAAGYHVGDTLAVLRLVRGWMLAETDPWRKPARREAYARLRAICTQPARLPA